MVWAGAACPRCLSEPPALKCKNPEEARLLQGFLHSGETGLGRPAYGAFGACNQFFRGGFAQAVASSPTKMRGWDAGTLRRLSCAAMDFCAAPIQSVTERFSAPAWPNSASANGVWSPLYWQLKVVRRASVAVSSTRFGAFRGSMNAPL